VGDTAGCWFWVVRALTHDAAVLVEAEGVTAAAAAAGVTAPLTAPTGGNAGVCCRAALALVCAPPEEVPTPAGVAVEYVSVDGRVVECAVADVVGGCVDVEALDVLRAAGLATREPIVMPTFPPAAVLPVEFAAADVVGGRVDAAALDVLRAPGLATREPFVLLTSPPAAVLPAEWLGVESPVSAHAIPFPGERAALIPSATAKPPIRPIYADVFMRIALVAGGRGLQSPRGGP
jgi:hypothetical protein